LSYFTLGPIHQLACLFNFNIFKVEEITTQGGSLRVYMGKIGDVGRGYLDVELKEKFAGLYEVSTYEAYQAKVDENINRLQDLLLTLDRNGDKIFGYGVPAKSSTLINYAEIGPYIRYMIDTTPAKQGKYTPGSGIPIYSPMSTKVGCEYAIMFPYNYKEEILAKEKGFLKNGGKFIIPIPDVRIIGDYNDEVKSEETTEGVRKSNV
jgi:hypothetical protein